MKLHARPPSVSFLTLPLALLLTGTQVFAQESTTQTETRILEEVMVTAQKREQTLQDVPVSVTAFSGEAIKETGAVDIRDIAGLTPNLSIKARGETEASVFIRGIGSQAPGIGADPAVGIFIDGMVASRGTNATSAFFDVERVEVVKGPQGTLFGRNASAGAISIITNKPDLEESYGTAMLGIGDEGQFRGQFVGNLAANDRFALRLGLNYVTRDGLIYNELTDQELLNVNSKNARLSALALISDNWEMSFLVEGVDTKNNDAIVSNDDVFAKVVRLNRSPGKQSLESTRFIWTNKWDFSDSMQLTSITGYYDHDVVVTPLDADETEWEIITFVEPQTNKTFSQELRLNGSSEKLDWFAGASYLEEELSFISQLRYDEAIVLDLFDAFFLCEEPGLPACGVQDESSFGENTTKSYALYGDFTYHISDRWSLTAGARYTKDKKNMFYSMPATDGVLGAIDGQIFGPITDGPLYANDTWSSFDPRLAIDFNVTDNTTLFANIAKGYKSGGLNRQASDFLPNPQVMTPFDEEKVTAFELGTKSKLLDGRATLNVSAFYNDYKDYQLEIQANLVPEVFNVGDIKTKGIELEGRVLATNNLEFAGTFAYLDSEVNKSALEPGLVGNSTPQAPKYSGSAQAHYYIQSGSGDWKLSGTLTYSDNFWFDIFNTLEQPSYTTLDLRVGYVANSERWSVAAFADNVTDEEYFVERFVFLDVANWRAPGRLMRVEFTVNF